MIPGAQDAGGIGRRFPLCVHDGLPADTGLVRRQDEWNRLVVSVQQHEEGVADDSLAHVVDLLDRVAHQTEAQAPAEAVGPLLLRHLFPVGTKPGEVLGRRSVNPPPLKERAPVEDRIVETQADQASRERELALARR